MIFRIIFVQVSYMALSNGILHIIMVVKGRNSGDCNSTMKLYMQL